MATRPNEGWGYIAGSEWTVPYSDDQSMEQGYTAAGSSENSTNLGFPATPAYDAPNDVPLVMVNPSYTGMLGGDSGNGSTWDNLEGGTQPPLDRGVSIYRQGGSRRVPNETSLSMGNHTYPNMPDNGSNASQQEIQVGGGGPTWNNPENGTPSSLNRGMLTYQHSVQRHENGYPHPTAQNTQAFIPEEESTGNYDHLTVDPSTVMPTTDQSYEDQRALAPLPTLAGASILDRGPSPITSQDGTEAMIICDACGQTLTGAHATGNLTRHRRTQRCSSDAPKREYKCSGCGKIYRRSDALLNHNRKHHGAPPGQSKNYTTPGFGS